VSIQSKKLIITGNHFANNIHTPGGVLILQVYEVVNSQITDWIEKKHINKKKNFSIAGDDTREGLTAVSPFAS
jgi:DNA gyrase/topoisomerase IV subunit B